MVNPRPAGERFNPEHRPTKPEATRWAHVAAASMLDQLATALVQHTDPNGRISGEVVLPLTIDLGQLDRVGVRRTLAAVTATRDTHRKFASRRAATNQQEDGRHGY